MTVDDGVGQRPGDGNGFIAAFVVNNDDQIDNLLGNNFVIGLAQGFGGIVSRHDNDDFLFLIHDNPKTVGLGVNPYSEGVTCCFPELPGCY